MEEGEVHFTFGTQEIKVQAIKEENFSYLKTGSQMQKKNTLNTEKPHHISTLSKNNNLTVYVYGVGREGVERERECQVNYYSAGHR